MSKETTVKDVYLYEAGQAEGYREGVKACIAALKDIGAFDSFTIPPALVIPRDEAIAACQRLLEEERDEKR